MTYEQDPTPVDNERLAGGESGDRLDPGSLSGSTEGAAVKPTANQPEPGPRGAAGETMAMAVDDNNDAPRQVGRMAVAHTDRWHGLKALAAGVSDGFSLVPKAIARGASELRTRDEP